MSRNELPADGNWEAVHTAVHRRMKKLGMSIARLSRESGVSEPTIRYIDRPEKRQRSTLVALSAGLRCRHDYLTDVLEGVADPEAPPQSPDDTAVTREFLRSELGSLEEKIYKFMFPISRNTQEIDGKIDAILDRRRKEREPPSPSRG